MYTVTRTRGINTKEICTVTECMSVRSWVNQHVGSDFHAPTICIYQGKPLLRAEWETTIIYADVVFIPLPLGGGGGGGGKNVMAMIGMAIVSILAIVVGQWYVPEVLLANGATFLGMGASVWGGLASAAVMLAGSMLVNALFPTQAAPTPSVNTQSLESASPTYSTSISQNSARLWQMIPESFGTNEQVPDLAANYWSEFQGNEQYLYVLL